MYSTEGSREFEGEGADPGTVMAGGDRSEKQHLSKRTGTEIPSSSSSSSSSSNICNFSLNDLQEALIEEILRRLPNFKSVFQCKCVCKKWYYLLSTPCFARCFITHHFSHHYNQNPSALIFQYWDNTEHRLFPFCLEPMFVSPRLELDYLCNERGSVKVLVIHKDLMLRTMERRDGFWRYYICDPFTKQSVALPLLEKENASFRTQIGFVCEPCYFEDSQGECTLNCNCRFRVVHINKLPKFLGDHLFKLWTYCSETQTWCESSRQGSEYGWDTDVVAYNGKLLWYNGRNIFAYDPFNPELSTFIDSSYIEFTTFLGFGVSQGVLRMIQLGGLDSPNNILAVWELKNDATMEWSLEDKFDLDTLTIVFEGQDLDDEKMTSLAHEIAGGSNYLSLLCLHPTDKDIVYFHCNGFLISCNIRTRELKIVGEFPLDFSEPQLVFHIELPLWPTTIPKPTEILPC